MSHRSSAAVLSRNALLTRPQPKSAIKSQVLAKIGKPWMTPRATFVGWPPGDGRRVLGRAGFPVRHQCGTKGRAMTIGSLTIWTIGHSTRTIEEFVDLLHRYQIEILVDVRHFPGSRRLPHFNKAALYHTLSAAGIHYEHLIELGGRLPVRPDSRNLLRRNASFRGYADYMETKPFSDGVDRLLEIARAGRTAVMCSEAVWWQCHRSMIADNLKAMGTQVVHILGPDRVQEHPAVTNLKCNRGSKNEPQKLV